MIIRETTTADIPQLVELRMRLFAETGEIESSTASVELRAATHNFFTDAAINGQSKSWAAQTDGILVATGTLAIFSRPPYPDCLNGEEAYILNIYTLPDYRRRLAATKIFEQMMEYAKSKGFSRVWLHTTPLGRSLYERFGFVTNPCELEWFPT